MATLSDKYLNGVRCHFAGGEGGKTVRNYSVYMENQMANNFF